MFVRVFLFLSVKTIGAGRSYGIYSRGSCGIWNARRGAFEFGIMAFFDEIIAGYPRKITHDIPQSAISQRHWRSHGKFRVEVQSQSSIIRAMDYMPKSFSKNNGKCR